MDQFCERCSEANGFGPDDHDCAQNLRRKAEVIVKDIKADGEGGWDSLERTALLEAEVELSTIYWHLENIREWWSERSKEAARRAENAYSVSSGIAKFVNGARAEVRNRMADL